MQELKKQTMEIINNINADWTEALRVGEQEGGVDLSEMFSKFSENITRLDNAFREAEERFSPVKRRGLFK